MKILMVAIPNHHFFQWVNQLENSGHDVFWFDVTDGGPKSNKIKWVTQIKGWKLKWNFPLRTKIKKGFPKLYSWIQKFNENNVSKAFQQTLISVKPDVVHCFEMQLSGLPILSSMNKNRLPFVYSSWGSDVFYFEQLGISKSELKQFYNRVNYLITDCKRDYQITISNGYKNEFLGVFPGNGGIAIDKSKIKPFSKRNTILVKGYDDGVGKALKVIEALTRVPNKLLKDKTIIIYSADNTVKEQIVKHKAFKDLNVVVYSRYHFIKNVELLEIMGESCIHIANSLSDGMPNALLEAMSMGVFPIQSNPGKVTEEVITHGENGYLINNPLDAKEIASHIKNAILNDTLRKSSQDFNVHFIKEKYNRVILKSKIEVLYKNILV